jgi:hypothetical protein
MPSLDEKRGIRREQTLKAGTISFDGSGIDCLVRKMSGYGKISRSKAKSAFPTHSTWLSTQSTAITIVTLSGERRVGSVSRSIRSPQLAASRRHIEVLPFNVSPALNRPQPLRNPPNCSAS